jgi:hypothetical protein
MLKDKVCSSSPHTEDDLKGYSVFILTSEIPTTDEQRVLFCVTRVSESKETVTSTFFKRGE